MTVAEIAAKIEGKILCIEEYADHVIKRAMASDLMSDVLTLSDHNAILITGLSNMQTIRTAEIAEIKHIVFVRGKSPSQAMINLAEEAGIMLMATRQSMFEVSGKLYAAGIKQGR